MDNSPKPTEKLVDVSRDEMLFDPEFWIEQQDGKASQRASLDAEVATVARMIAAHLEQFGYVIKRRPSLVGHFSPGSPGYKGQLTE